MHGGLLKLTENSAASIALPLSQILTLIGCSALAGLVLVIVSYLVAKIAEFPDKEDNDPAKKGMKKILGSANQLFLTVGLTGILLLVNHNIVRAFAIYAALGLIRFRVNLNNKAVNAAMLFSILVGVSCGLGEITLAIAMTATYVVLMFGLAAFIKIVGPESGKKR